MVTTPGYQQRLDELMANSDQLREDFRNIANGNGIAEKGKTQWLMEYQLWYSEAVMVVRQILPH